MKTIYLVITEEKWVDENYQDIVAFENFDNAKEYFDNEINKLSQPNGLISELKERGYEESDYCIHRDIDMNTYSVYEYNGDYNAYIYITEKTLM